MSLIILLGFIAFYFLPTLIGGSKRQGCAIFVINLFLGWTLIGWVIALAWACYNDPDPIDVCNLISNDKVSQYDELEKLAELKNKGIISDEEFIEQKQKILGSNNFTTSSDDKNTNENQ